MRYVPLLVPVLSFLVLFAPQARAEEPAPLQRASVLVPVAEPCCPPVTWAAQRPLREAAEKAWHVTLVGYAWMTDISGESYTDGVESDIDIAFDDLFDKLDYSFQGVAEIEFKRWFFAVDTTFQKLEQDGPTLGGRLPTTISLEETVIDLRLGYTVLCREIGKDRWGACCYPRHYKLDVAIGARYWNDKTTLDIASAAALLPGLSDTESWWDPYVGVRARWPFAKRWFLNVYGDIGGFGIGDASDLTWQVQAVLGFRVTRWMFVALGYRALDIDRVDGSGPDKNGTDLLYHGPALAIGFNF